MIARTEVEAARVVSRVEAAVDSLVVALQEGDRAVGIQAALEGRGTVSSARADCVTAYDVSVRCGTPSLLKDGVHIYVRFNPQEPLAPYLSRG